MRRRTGSNRPRMASIPARWPAHLGAALPKGALFTVGAGHFFSWIGDVHAAAGTASEIQYSYGFGAVGQGIGVAIGTGAGNPGRPHIAVEGDGSLMFNLQELETVVRHKMQMVLLVWNDAGYGAEVHKLIAKGFDDRLAQWDSPDFVALAKGIRRRRRAAEGRVRTRRRDRRGTAQGRPLSDRRARLAHHADRSVCQGALRHESHAPLLRALA